MFIYKISKKIFKDIGSDSSSTYAIQAQTWTSNPLWVITPRYIWDFFYDSNSRLWYMSKWLTNLSWQLVQLSDIVIENSYTLWFWLLYNFLTVESWLLAPTWWHVPSNSEVTTLKASLWTYTAAKAALVYPTSALWWNSWAWTDLYWFSWLPAWYITSSWTFKAKNSNCYRWTSTRYSATVAYWYWLASWNIQQSQLASAQGSWIRLLMDDPNSWTSWMKLTDYDWNVYETVKIWNQVVTKSNFKCTHLNNWVAIENRTSSFGTAVAPAYCSYSNDAIVEQVFTNIISTT